MSLVLKLLSREYINKYNLCHWYKELLKGITQLSLHMVKQDQEKRILYKVENRSRPTESFLNQSGIFLGFLNKSQHQTKGTKFSFLSYKFTTNLFMILLTPVMENLWKWDGTSYSNLQLRTCLKDSADLLMRLWNGGRKVRKIR